MDFESTDVVPKAMSNAERSRKFRKESPEKAKANRRKYRHDNSKWQTDAHYLSRPFVAWDGEGITDNDGSNTHRYVMLACKSSDGDSDYVSRVKGLGTAQAFDFILAAAERNAGSIHVIYGGGYDFNMFMRDIGKDDLRKIYADKFAVWNGYRIGWRPGKSFYLCRVDAAGKRVGMGVTIYDVVSFFQCAFVKACDDYLGDKFYRREDIVSNKALRSSFTVDDIPEVKSYNDAELHNLLALMDELRKRLNKVGLRPRRWDGPGAVASALLSREAVKDSMQVSPDPVAKAARYAYAGGRFEVIRFGHVMAPAYEYDVNSAYPAALRFVPDLNKGHWEHSPHDAGKQPFALYHVRWTVVRHDIPGPLFRRDANGTICYPMQGQGWYWSPEVEVAREYCAMGYGEIEISETWVFHSTTTDKPFGFIEPLYNKRRALKKAGDGAHVGIKLALNSLYGKLAQQVGWERTEKGLRIPPFHQIEWAGFTTSHCRAAVLRACLGNLDAIIAFETDAVFTSAPLNVPTGSALGEFEAVEFSDLTYVQSGMYFGTKTDGTPVNKTRGVDRGSLTREQVLEGMAIKKAVDRQVTASLTRFVGAGVALSQSFDRWRKWETVTKNLSLEPTGKRIHLECEACDETGGIKFGAWHRTFCPLMNDAHCCEFPVEWINPDPNMTELSEMRWAPNDYE